MSAPASPSSLSLRLSQRTYPPLPIDGVGLELGRWLAEPDHLSITKAVPLFREDFRTVYILTSPPPIPFSFLYTLDIFHFRRTHSRHEPPHAHTAPLRLVFNRLRFLDRKVAMSLCVLLVRWGYGCLTRGASFYNRT
jgi:hypothetical protein